jgi:hypothetical protein
VNVPTNQSLCEVIMKFRVFFLSALLLLSGCGSISTKDNLLVPRGYFPGDRIKHGESQVRANSGAQLETPDPLLRAYEQVTERDGTVGNLLKASEQRASGPLPTYLVDEPLVRKLIVSAYQAVNGSTPSQEIDRSDVASFSKMMDAKFLGQQSSSIMGRADAEKPASKLIHLYLAEYYAGKNGFVDREGAVFKRPEIKNSIGNDIITAALDVTLEAVFDATLHNPVYYAEESAKKNWNTPDNREPTVVGALKVAEKLAADGSAQGITSRKQKAIRYLSGLAADRSKVLSGAAYRAVGGADLGIVVAGKFSIGDNDTLAKMLDTTFEVAAKRITEEVARRGLVGANDGQEAARGDVKCNESAEDPGQRLLDVLGCVQ